MRGRLSRKARGAGGAAEVKGRLLRRFTSSVLRIRSEGGSGFSDDDEDQSDDDEDDENDENNESDDEGKQGGGGEGLDGVGVVDLDDDLPGSGKVGRRRPSSNGSKRALGIDGGGGRGGRPRRSGQGQENMRSSRMTQQRVTSLRYTVTSPESEWLLVGRCAGVVELVPPTTAAMGAMTPSQPGSVDAKTEAEEAGRGAAASRAGHVVLASLTIRGMALQVGQVVPPRLELTTADGIGLVASGIAAYRVPPCPTVRVLP